MGLVSIVFAAWMLIDGDGATDLATVASLFTGIASLLLALIDFFRQEPIRPDPAMYADDLARSLKAQWLEEFHPRKPLLAVAQSDGGGDVHLWRTEGRLRRVKTLTGHNDSVYAMAFSSDGSLLATAGADGTVRVWDVEA